jgi:hypothetical protein
MSSIDLHIHFGSNHHHHHLQESHLAPFQVTKEWQELEQCTDKYCILACWRYLKISFTQFHDLILLLAESMWEYVLWVFIYLQKALDHLHVD